MTKDTIGQTPGSERGHDVDEWERRRQERHNAYQQAATPLIAALTGAGIDPTDFGVFVNRPLPGVLEPSRFDHVRSLPILIDWLPRIDNEDVKQSMVRHLKTKAAKPSAAQPLLDEFRRAQDPYYKWAIADTLEFVCDKAHYQQIVDFAADRRHGLGRAPLMGMLWRVKTSQADSLLRESLDDPDVARAAISSLWRRVGNEQARPLIEPLVNHPHEHVHQAARDYLKRIDRSLRT